MADRSLAGLALAVLAMPVAAQDAARDVAVDLPAAQQAPAMSQPGRRGGDSVFSGDWLTIGLGFGVSASYSGSDDYVLTPLPIVQGRLGGIGISPNAAGLTLDVTPEARSRPDFAIGPTFRFRGDRDNRIRDQVVKAAGRLDSAFELGLAASYSLPGILQPRDRLSFGLAVSKDVAGAHGGTVIEPGLAYSSPIGPATFASLSVSAPLIDGDFARYYYSVSPAQSAASGLPAFDASGGFESLGVNLLVGHDLDGNARNGGLSVIAIGGYSRLFGDAADTPYTSLRGRADQFLGVLGVGYTF